MKFTITVVIVIIALVGGFYLYRRMKNKQKPAIRLGLNETDEVPGIMTDPSKAPRISDLDPQLEQYYQAWHGTNTI